MATDTLQPGDLAFNYGANLHKDPQGAVSAQLVTVKDNNGNYTKMQFKIVYDLDMSFIKLYNSPKLDGSQGNYQVNYNEVGFHENKELFDSNTKNLPPHRLSLSFVGTMPVVTIEMPLANPIKKDSESLNLI